VWIVDLDPPVGHKQGGVRPTIVVSTDMFDNSLAGLLMIVPTTTTDRRVRAHIRVDPPEGGLAKTSFILTDQLRTVSRLRLGRRLGSVSSVTMKTLEKQIRIHAGL
jgi:mRNA interferase MazF